MIFKNIGWNSWNNRINWDLQERTLGTEKTGDRRKAEKLKWVQEDAKALYIII